ncbi:hypothetical protein SAMN05192570_1220 [Brevundimonas viscosa]|uniref:Uncharacterized protein n=2 Tax=Brevundimonas viscosa TaxID=871741 RepID=A0A1I6PRR0_9CAUL|nr:hypothetical protein SAMN05192570_1220 [Brevundimonas viscosa]
MAGWAVFYNIHAAMAGQAQRLADIAERREPALIARYARAMLDAGFTLMEQQAQAVQTGDLPVRGVEAVMAAHSAIFGLRTALEEMADTAGRKDANDRILSHLHYFSLALGSLKQATDMLRHEIENG